MKYFILTLILMFSLLITTNVQAQRYTKNLIAVDSTILGNGTINKPLRLNLDTINFLISEQAISVDSINALISDSIATVSGGSTTYGDICNCKYLHMIIQFNGAADPTVTFWKSNIDFDLIGGGQGVPIVEYDGVGNYYISSATLMGENITSTQEETFASIAFNTTDYKGFFASWVTTTPAFVITDSSGTPDDPSNFYYAQIKIEYPN